MEIDKTLSISKYQGYEALVSYGPKANISLEMESSVLDIAHASHGIYKTSYVASDVRYIHYWFRTKSALRQFIKRFKTKAASYPGWTVEEFLKEYDFDHIEYGLLSDNSLL